MTEMVGPAADASSLRNEKVKAERAAEVVVCSVLKGDDKLRGVAVEFRRRSRGAG